MIGRSTRLLVDFYPSLGPPHHHTDAGEQLFEIEGLLDVVIGVAFNAASMMMGITDVIGLPFKVRQTWYSMPSA